MVKSTLYDLTDNHDLVRKAAYMEHRLDNLPNPGILVFIKELHDEIINHSQNFIRTTDNPVIATNWTFKGVLRSYLPASTDYDVVNLKSLNQTYLGSLRLNAEERQTVAGPVTYLSDNDFEGPVVFRNTVQRYHGQAGPYNVIDESSHYTFTKYPKCTKADYKEVEPAEDEFATQYWVGAAVAKLPQITNIFTQPQFISENFCKRGTYNQTTEKYTFLPPITDHTSTIGYSAFVTLYDLESHGLTNLNIDTFNKTVRQKLKKKDKNTVPLSSSFALVEDKKEEENVDNPILLTLNADYDPNGNPSLKVGTNKVEYTEDDEIEYIPDNYEVITYLGRETWTTGLHITPSLAAGKNSEIFAVTSSYTPTPQQIKEEAGGVSQFALASNFLMYPTGKVLNKSTGEIEEFNTTFIVNSNAAFVTGGSNGFTVTGTSTTTPIPLFTIGPITGGYSIEHYAPANFSNLVRVGYPAAGKSFSVGRQDGALYNEYFAVGSTAIETNRPIVAKLGDATVLNIESRTIDTDTYPIAEINGGVIVNCLSDVDGPLFRVEYTTEEGSQTITHPIIYSSKEENLIYNNLAVMDGETELFSTFPLQTYVGTPMVVAGAMEVSPDVVDSEEYEPVVIVDVVDDDDIIDLATISHNHSLNRSLTVLQTELSIKDYSGNDLSTFSLVEDGWVHKLNCDSHYTVGAPDEGNTEIVAKWYLTQELGSYAKSADVAESYATKEELASYYTKTETNALIADFITEDAVDEKLEDYTTTTVLESTYAKKADHYTKTETNALIADFITEDAVDTKLEEYAKTSEVDGRLEDYTTTTVLESTYAKKSELPDMDDYATIDYVDSKAPPTTGNWSITSVAYGTNAAQDTDPTNDPTNAQKLATHQYVSEHSGGGVPETNPTFIGSVKIMPNSTATLGTTISAGNPPNMSVFTSTTPRKMMSAVLEGVPSNSSSFPSGYTDLKGLRIEIDSGIEREIEGIYHYNISTKLAIGTGVKNSVNKNSIWVCQYPYTSTVQNKWSLLWDQDTAITTVQWDDQSNLPNEFLQTLDDPQLFLRRTNSTENGEILLKDQLIMKYGNEETIIKEFTTNVTRQYELYLQEAEA